MPSPTTPVLSACTETPSVRFIVFISRTTLYNERSWIPLGLEASFGPSNISAVTFGPPNSESAPTTKRLRTSPRLANTTPAFSVGWSSYTLEYRRGSANGNADFLSRLPQLHWTQRPYEPRSRGHLPYPSKRLHSFRAVHTGHWLGWAHAAPLQPVAKGPHGHRLSSTPKTIYVSPRSLNRLTALPSAHALPKTAAEPPYSASTGSRHMGRALLMTYQVYISGSRPLDRGSTLFPLQA